MALSWVAKFRSEGFGYLVNWDAKVTAHFLTMNDECYMLECMKIYNRIPFGSSNYAQKVLIIR